MSAPSAAPAPRTSCFGFESGSDEVLARMRKGARLDHALAILKGLQARGDRRQPPVLRGVPWRDAPGARKDGRVPRADALPARHRLLRRLRAAEGLANLGCAAQVRRPHPRASAWARSRLEGRPPATPPGRRRGGDPATLHLDDAAAPVRNQRPRAALARSARRVGSAAASAADRGATRCRRGERDAALRMGPVPAALGEEGAHLVCVRRRERAARDAPAGRCGDPRRVRRNHDGGGSARAPHAERAPARAPRPRAARGGGARGSRRARPPARAPARRARARRPRRRRARRRARGPRSTRRGGEPDADLPSGESVPRIC